MGVQGSKLLKVSSILMIIGGIIGVVGSIIMGLTAGVVQSVFQTEEFQQEMAEAGVAASDLGTFKTVLLIALCVLIVSAIIDLVAGFIGKNNWNNPAKATTMIILGVLSAVLSLIGNIMFSSEEGTQILSYIIGLLIPALYVIGAFQLKKQV